MAKKNQGEKQLRLRRERLQQLGTLTADELRRIAGGVDDDDDGTAKNVSRGCSDS